MDGSRLPVRVGDGSSARRAKSILDRIRGEENSRAFRLRAKTSRGHERAVVWPPKSRLLRLAIHLGLGCWSTRGTTRLGCNRKHSRMGRGACLGFARSLAGRTFNLGWVAISIESISWNGREATLAQTPKVRQRAETIAARQGKASQSRCWSRVQGPKGWLFTPGWGSRA